MEFLRKCMGPVLLCICLICLTFSSGTSGADDRTVKSSHTSRGVEEVKRSSEWDDLIAWARARGAEFNESIVDIIPLEESRVDRKNITRLDHAMISRAGFEAGMDIVIMPPSLWIVSENITKGRIWKDGKGPAIGPQVGRTEGTNYGWDTALSLWLLLEKAKGEASDWYPFLRTLPERVANVLSFTDEDIEEIHYQPLVHLANGYKNSYITQMWSHTQEWGQLPEGWNTYEKFLWASSIVWSRSFNIHLSDELLGDSFTPVEGETTADLVASMLIPFNDMLNHNIPNNVDWKLVDGKVRIVSRSAVAPGSMVTTSYGNKPNDILLALYGFISDHNLVDKADLFTSMHDLALWYENTYSPIPFTPPGEQDSPEVEAQRKSFIATAEEIAKAVGEVVQGAMTWPAEHFGFALADGSAGANMSMLEADGHGFYLNGLVDPRIIAALAALGYSQGMAKTVGGVEDAHGFKWFNSTTLDLNMFAVASIGAAMGEDFDCSTHGAGVERFLRFAAGILIVRADEILNSFPTTAEEDQRILDEAKAVESGDCSSLSDGESKTCPFVEPLSEQRKAILRFRMMKKDMYQAGKARLAELCLGPDAENVERSEPGEMAENEGEEAAYEGETLDYPELEYSTDTGSAGDGEWDYDESLSSEIDWDGPMFNGGGPDSGVSGSGVDEDLEDEE